MIEVGQTIGNYKVTAKLGEGGMGVVYLAEHPVIGRKVAMKAIHPELSRNAEVVSRFMTEAKSVNQIGNEHIVDISDFGNTADGEFYFIMEFLQGEALADRMKNERVLQPARALQIAAQVADALAASHVHGIIHRDLKPENIFLINRGNTPDFVKVLDFGLAKLTQGEEKATHKTRTGSVMGTPFYMAPEQCEGRASIDQRADVYSLGVILYEMLTGTVPFTGEGYGEIIVKHITQPAPPPRSLNPSLTAGHEALLMRALAKKRDDRFASMDEFRAAILDPERYVQGRAAIEISSTMMAVPSTSSPPVRRPAPITETREVPRAAATPVTAAQRLARVPSVFDEAGAVSPEDLEPRTKRKTGLIIGGAIAAVALVGGLFALTRDHADGTQAAGEVPTTVAPGPSEPAVPTPPVASKVKIAVESVPSGAKVYREDTAEFLGQTPTVFEPAAGASFKLLFKKDGFKSQLSPAVGDKDQTVRITLEPEAPPPVAAEPPEPKESAKGERRGSSRRPGHTGVRKGAVPAASPSPAPNRQPYDSDDVLAPKL